MRSLLVSLCLLAVIPLFAASARAGESNATQPATKPFELLDGDRVVFLGGTFFEREAKWGYIETALTSRFPDRNITFRNLGYAGDTVRCEARTVCEGWANFGPPEEGFEKLRKLVTEIKPTVVFIAYGMGESFEGEKALPQFVSDYNKLLDMLTEASGGKPRFVLIGPNYHEDLGRPLPEPKEHNRDLKGYCAAIKSLANDRGCIYADLFGLFEFISKSRNEGPLTDDGIQVTAAGDWQAALTIVHSLRLPAPFGPWAEFDAVAGKVGTTDGVRLSNVKATASSLSFDADIERLPLPSVEQIMRSGSHKSFTAAGMIKVAGLAPGRYALKSGSFVTDYYPPDEWARGVPIFGQASAARAEILRQAIVAKNAVYFNYWRHENDTYILGYRKHEQGKNSVEFPEFVKLAEEKDKEIAKLRVPQAVTYTLEREEKPGK